MNVGITDSRSVAVAPHERAAWRAVAIPSEHGGWGLTLEPALLGLLVATSWAGTAVAFAAILAFLARTPAKLVLVDVWRRRWLPRTGLALAIAAAEIIAVVALGAYAASTGTRWLIPMLFAVPLMAIELWFDMRSRGRRLTPEMCGAVGITAVAAAVALAGGRNFPLAIGLWLVLAARAVATIPFVRAQIFRLRRGTGPTKVSDMWQLAGVAVAAAAVVVDRSLLVGALGIVALTVAQYAWIRRPPIPAKVLGKRQMAIGFALVAVTAIGVGLLG